MHFELSIILLIGCALSQKFEWKLFPRCIEMAIVHLNGYFKFPRSLPPIMPCNGLYTNTTYCVYLIDCLVLCVGTKFAFNPTSIHLFLHRKSAIGINVHEILKRLKFCIQQKHSTTTFFELLCVFFSSCTIFECFFLTVFVFALTHSC